MSFSGGCEVVNSNAMFMKKHSRLTFKERHLPALLSADSSTTRYNVGLNDWSLKDN